MKTLIPVLGVAAILLISAFPAGADDPEPEPEPEDSTLGDFEEAVEGEDSEGEPRKKTRSELDDDDDFWAEAFAHMFLQIGKGTVMTVAGGGVWSWLRVNPSGDPEMMADITPRLTGEPAIPFFRADVFYQNVESDVEAVDLVTEAGYGPFALHYRLTHYTEDRPDIELDLSAVYGVYRMSFTRHFELDLGFGSMTLDGGSRTSGFSFTMPITIQPSPYIGGRFRPAWGYLSSNTIKDFTLVLTGSLPYASLEAGYRWVSAGGASLNGPVMGIAVHF